MNPKTTADKIRMIGWNNQGFPVNPIAIAKTFGIRVLQTDLPEDVSGALIKDAGKDPMIVLHYKDSNNRKRFTCAHELGHYVKRAESNELTREYAYIDYRNNHSAQGTQEAEIFANQFAANLLIPEQELRQLVKTQQSHLEIAAYFGVSVESIKYRLKNLKLL